MSLKVIHLAAEIENADDFHVARLLLLLKAGAGRSNKPVQGIMKLAKMDFLLRYPNCLVRVLRALGKQQATESIPEEERNTIEARMIRFRFGPWDKRYRRWIGLLVSRGLAHAYLDGRTVNVKLTEGGKEVANHLATLNEFEPLALRSRLIASAVGSFSATRLKEFIYEVFPEIVHMRWGKDIEL
jgi:hypothetical protein